MKTLLPPHPFWALIRKSASPTIIGSPVRTMPWKGELSGDKARLFKVVRNSEQRNFMLLLLLLSCCCGSVWGGGARFVLSSFKPPETVDFLTKTK